MQIKKNKKCPNGPYYVFFQHRGKKIERTCGTRDKREANEKGKAIYESIVNEDWNTLRALSVRRATCTIGDVLKIYEAAAESLELQHTTARNNAGALRAMVLAAEPKVLIFESLAERYKFADSKSAAILDAALVENFKIKKKGLEKYSLNSHLRQARSVFSRFAMHHYKSLALPDISEFMKAPGWSKAGNGGGYKIIPADVLAEIEASAVSQRAKSPDVYRIYMLVRKLGMRSIEVLRARTTDIFQVVDGRWAIRIISKKSGREAVIPRTLTLSPTLAEEFVRAGKDEFLIGEGLNDTARHDLIYETVNLWLRNFLKGRKKCLYELRKAAGSDIATKQGLLAAQKFLGHKRYETTKQWYAEYIDEIFAIS